MISCHVRYEIDPDKIEAFERFAERWMELVERHGGTHHGYFLPAEGASDIAYAVSTSAVLQSIPGASSDMPASYPAPPPGSWRERVRANAPPARG